MEQKLRRFHRKPAELLFCSFCRGKGQVHHCAPLLYHTVNLYSANGTVLSICGQPLPSELLNQRNPSLYKGGFHFRPKIARASSGVASTLPNSAATRFTRLINCWLPWANTPLL